MVVIVTLNSIQDFLTTQHLRYFLITCHQHVLIVYTTGSTQVLLAQKKHGRKRSTSPEQELFMVLARMRCGLLLQDPAHRYGMSTMNVSWFWITWLNFLHQQLRALPIWPTRTFVDDNMPACFSQRFPETRVILDCMH